MNKLLSGELTIVPNKGRSVSETAHAATCSCRSANHDLSAPRRRWFQCPCENGQCPGASPLLGPVQNQGIMTNSIYSIAFKGNPKMFHTLVQCSIMRKASIKKKVDLNNPGNFAEPSHKGFLWFRYITCLLLDFAGCIPTLTGLYAIGYKQAMASCPASPHNRQCIAAFKLIATVWKKRLGFWTVHHWHDFHGSLGGSGVSRSQDIFISNTQWPLNGPRKKRKKRKWTSPGLLILQASAVILSDS